MLSTFYQDAGYKDVSIISDTVFYSPQKDGLIVQIQLSEGPKYRFRNITWDGNELYENELLEEVLDIKKGDLYNLSLIHI